MNRLIIKYYLQKNTEIFPPDTGGAVKMAEEMKIPYLGNLPIDPLIARSCDEGSNPIEEHPQSLTVLNLKSIISSAYKVCPMQNDLPSFSYHFLVIYFNRNN